MALLLTLLTVALCFLAFLLFFERSYNRRSRAQTTIHTIRDPAVAHRALIENADDFANQPASIFPVSLAVWPNGDRNDNITTANHGPHWRALRCNLTAQIIHPSRLCSLAPLMQDAALALVADLLARATRLGAGGEVAIRVPTNTALFGLVTLLCFGDTVDGQNRRALGHVVRDNMDAVGELSPRFDGSMVSKLVNWRAFRRISALFDRQTELYRPLFAARRESRSKVCGGIVHPYVDSLLDLRVPDGDSKNGDVRRALREGEMVPLVFEFLGAGTGSITTCVEWTLAHLINQPEFQTRLRREIDDVAGGAPLSAKSLRSMPYLNALVLESLRMHPPLVMFKLGDIGRDKAMWTDPDEFRPERFLEGGEAEHVGPLPGSKEIRMMPFGAGHRHCPGVGMAMMLIKCFLATLVREFEWTLSAQDCSRGVDMTEQDGFVKLMKKPLCARVARRT
ncbi:cytochrome P450 89A2-like [Lolium rigidum]|uniref:cytochrome P450 89A2-like n=1 Tax=Lolium rigidum TaxID=89674 RepID=UPI001F5DBA1C|nr:cytochrome P450 89A2-like [Lolium rigidum]